MIKTKCSERGLCCESCQEDVNLHRCDKCGGRFEDGDEIYCKHHAHSDSEHYHILCKPEDSDSKETKIKQELRLE